MRFTLNFKPSNKSVRSLLSYSHLTALVAKVPKSKGCRLFPDECDKRGTKQLLISADSSGSNGYRVRLWKWELQQFADATGLEVTVCHLPPGTSKWNKIEHRLKSHISMNWRGHPLVSHEVIVKLIAATTTSTGLIVKAELDTGVYPTHIKISDDELATVHITPHMFHGEWNYTISPTSPSA